MKTAVMAITLFSDNGTSRVLEVECNYTFENTGVYLFSNTQ